MVRTTLKGFTLIELLIIITVISILSSIAFTFYKNAQGAARDGIRKKDLNILAEALEIYFQKNGHYIALPECLQSDSCPPDSCSRDRSIFYDSTPDMDQNLGIAPFLNGNLVPKDPLTKQPYCYISQNSGQSFRLFTKLESQDSAINLTSCTNPTFNYTIVSQDLEASCAP